MPRIFTFPTPRSNADPRLALAIGQRAFEIKEKAMDMMLAPNGPGVTARLLCRAGPRIDGECRVGPKLALA